MWKIIYLAFAALLMLSTGSMHEGFGTYKVIEAYEIRPGVLMMPRYSTDNQVCEIALQRLHYSPETIRLDSGLSRNELDPIFQEIAPTEERGPKIGRDLITTSGHGITTTLRFKNVTIQIIGRDLSASAKQGIIENDVVAIVRWNMRNCR